MSTELAIRPIASGPLEPLTVAETGLPLQSLVELLAKTMYHRGRLNEGQAMELLALSRPVVDQLFESMKRDAQVQALTQSGPLQFEYALTEGGRQLALAAFERSRYVGPAPVPYAQYLVSQQQYSLRSLPVERLAVGQALESLVIGEDVIRAIGAGVISRQAILVFGPSGNGKSTIASAVRAMLGPVPVPVPFALDIGGHLVRVFDARVHQPLDALDIEARGVEPGAPRMDRRFAYCLRPLVTMGSEMTLRDLDLGFSEIERTYGAPPQLRANGGVLVIDDLGRQSVRPEELLNRWMSPMATGEEQLVLQTGELVRFPFDVVLVFATNLSPQEIGDEAFLRRIRHKVRAVDPTEEQFVEIFRRQALAMGLGFDESVVRRIIRCHYTASGRPLRGAHPGDILRNLYDFAVFDDEPPAFTFEAIDRACNAYFA